ncbi:MAG: capsular polysaccharide synthesis protein [Saprospiraceae bacterium]
MKNRFKTIIKNVNTVRKYMLMDRVNKSLVNNIICEAEVIDYISKYSYVLNNSQLCFSNRKFIDKIWILWYQGIDFAPLIVKKCLESVRRFSEGIEIIILDEKNIKDYISIPDYVYEKKKMGYITNTHFSDILRACLLAEHGGIWIDSTVMLTAPIPKIYLNSPFFCFSTTPVDFRGVTNIAASSWFIYSNGMNVTMNTVKKLLLEYWKFETEIRHYYLFHLFFNYVISTNNECKNEWEEVPFFSNIPPQVMQIELFQDYSEERFNQITKMSSIHKLSFYGGSQYDIDKPNTIYKHLILNLF